MKILHVITSLRTGGAEKLMVDLLPRFNSCREIEADLCLFDGVDTPFRREAEAAGIEIYDFGAKNSVYNPLNILRLLKLMRSYDIIHTHNTSPQLFAAIASLFSRKKLVTTEHNTTNRRRNHRIFKLIDQWMYKRYKKIICISDKAEENIKAYLPSLKSPSVCTIYNGVDISKFSAANPSQELSDIAGTDTKKVIMVAAFRPQKDQKTLIRALAELPENFHLFLVGEGECQNECKNLSDSLSIANRTHFFGRRSDVAQLLKAADFVVMSSHYEGLSLSSLEGMAVGKPFLASDVDGLREVVKGAGILFPHEDASALASEIMKLDSDTDLYRMTSKACAARAAGFDIPKMVDGYLRIYETC